MGLFESKSTSEPKPERRRDKWNIYNISDCLLDKKYINMQDRQCDTPLEFAIKNENIDIVRYLIKNDAIIPKNALSIAGNNIEMVRCLIENGANVSKIYLEQICERDYLDILKYLVQIGIEIDFQYLKECISFDSFHIRAYLNNYNRELQVSICNKFKIALKEIDEASTETSINNEEIAGEVRSFNVSS